MFECIIFVQDHAKWDSGQVTSDITLGTGLKHPRDFWLSFKGSQNIFGLFVIQISPKLNMILSERTVSCSITIHSLAMIWTAVMYIFSIFKCRSLVKITTL